MVLIVLLFGLVNVGNICAAQLGYLPEKEKSLKLHAGDLQKGQHASVEILDKYTKCTMSFPHQIHTVTALERSTGTYFSKTATPFSRSLALYNDNGNEWEIDVVPQQKFTECMKTFKSLASCATRFKLWKELRKFERKSN